MIKRIKGSLFAKVFILTVAVLLCVSFLVYGVLAWYMPQTYSNNLNAALDEQTSDFIYELEHIRMQDSGGLFDQFLQNTTISMVELYTADGVLVETPSNQNSFNDGITGEALGGASYESAPIISNSYYFSFADDNSQYILTVYGEASQIAELRQSFVSVLSILFCVILLVSLATAWVYSRIITNPVLKISRISKEMSDMKLEWQLEERRSDELGVLENSLNTLSRKLSATLEELQSANLQLQKDIEHQKALEQAQQEAEKLGKTLSEKEKDVLWAEDEKEQNTAFARYMDDAMFLIPTPQVLQKIITGLEDLYTHDIADLDMQGDLYEYMLGKLATAGQNGQFRTPKHIRDMMVELVQPTPDDFICDPACGTAGFLVSSAQYLRAHYEDSMTPEQWQHFAGPMFTGFDMDRTMLRISAMNLMLHSITNPEIDYKDSVSKQNSICSKYTVCLANPPFKGTVDAESINDDLKAVTNTKKTELLFLALFLRMLKTGGRCACIVPDGVLFGSSKAHQSIRKELIENHQLRAVISMPSGVFKPYAGVSTAVLVFTKTGAGGTDKVWFYDMKADGLSLDDKRTEVKENDIPDIIARFHNLDAETDRKRTEQSFFVPKEEIAANGYDLSINKYKETEYVPVEYPSTTEILADLHELEMEITKGLAELEEMV